MCKLCVFSGTTEGRRLVESVRGRGAQIVACVATEYGQALTGAHTDLRVHTGRMNADEMRAFFLSEGFDMVIDATHPYAASATENIETACAQAHIPYLRLNRESEASSCDGVFFSDAASCVLHLKDTRGNVLLTIGSKELPAFCADEALRVRLYARVLPTMESLKICLDNGIAPDHIIAMQGPFDEDMNRATLRSVNAAHLVTKDSGIPGGYKAKIRAAKSLGVQAVIIGRPHSRDGCSPGEVIRLLSERFSLAPARKRVVLAGGGMGDPETRTIGLERALREADMIIGSKRMLEAVNTSGIHTREAVAADAIRGIIEEDKTHTYIVVLLSGDTGFYSGARKLLKALDKFEVEILPGIGSLQYFCARLRRPWEDVRAISLHGRDWNLVGEVSEYSEVFMLTGGDNDMKNVLAALKNARMSALKAYVGERLGYPDEKISQGTVEELAQCEYDPLSVILVENEQADRAVVTHGLPDAAFEQNDAPMTKSEIRSIALSKLQLTRCAVVYDIGSGSGSIAAEAALQAPHGHVYAIERMEKAAALTRRNADKFRLTNVSVIHGSAPEALLDLPAPTHAFIGGSAGSMREIIDCLLKKNPEVRIVASAVTLETIAQLSVISREFDSCDIAQISVAKPREAGKHRLMIAQNPVCIFSMQQGGSIS